jgi:hypothetical protein
MTIECRLATNAEIRSNSLDPTWFVAVEVRMDDASCYQMLIENRPGRKKCDPFGDHDHREPPPSIFPAFFRSSDPGSVK